MFLLLEGLPMLRYIYVYIIFPGYGRVCHAIIRAGGLKNLYDLVSAGLFFMKTLWLPLH